MIQSLLDKSDSKMFITSFPGSVGWVPKHGLMEVEAIPIQSRVVFSPGLRMFSFFPLGYMELISRSWFFEESLEPSVSGHGILTI